MGLQIIAHVSANTDQKCANGEKGRPNVACHHGEYWNQNQKHDFDHT